LPTGRRRCSTLPSLRGGATLPPLWGEATLLSLGSGATLALGQQVWIPWCEKNKGGDEEECRDSQDLKPETW